MSRCYTRSVTFKERLRLAREARGMTRFGLSRAAGLHGSHVGLLESSDERKGVTAETAAALAEVLKVPVRWLITGEGEAPDLTPTEAA